MQATTREVADRLGVHHSTISRLARTHAIGSRIGAQWVFTKAEETKLRKHCKFQKGNPEFSKKRK